MRHFIVLGVALSALALAGCATKGYVRRQAANVNDRVIQIQTSATALSAKHETDVAQVNERINTADNKLHETATQAAQANANAAQANANAARADASAAQALASAALADANAARAEAAGAQQRTTIAENTPPASIAPGPATLPKTGSPLPLIGLSGFLSLGAAGALRLLRR